MTVSREQKADGRSQMPDGGRQIAGEKTDDCRNMVIVGNQLIDVRKS
jgi:hypothetical protein